MEPSFPNRSHVPDQSVQAASAPLSEDERSAPQYDLRGASIYGFAPGSTGSALVAGATVQDNQVVGTQPQLSSVPKAPCPGIPHNLPRSGAQFVGREIDIETLHQQLQG